jgi:hypothetical protein
LNNELGGSLANNIQDEQEIKPVSFIPALSRMDNYRLFIAARKGIKYSPRVVEKMGISRKRYYTALSQLNRHGLIRRDPATGMSICTMLGEMICRCILEMKAYEDHAEELRMIDTLKQTGQFTPDRIAQFLEKVIEDNLTKSMFSTLEMVWSYDAMVSVLLEHVRSCTDEILIATRMPSEAFTAALQAEVTRGIRIRVLSDASLAEAHYAKLGMEAGNSNAQSDRPERGEVAGDPSYQDSRIERRVTHVPFGMAVIDSKQVWLELVNAHNLPEFSGGFNVQDATIAHGMKRYYEKLWAQSQDIAGFCKGCSTETAA